MTLNILAIALGAVGGMAVGALWFSPVLFGKPWRRLANVDPAAKQQWWVYVLALIATLVTSAVIAVGASVVHEAVGGSYLGVALAVASIGWLGFTLSRNAVEYLFESRPATLFAIDSGHQLAVVVVIATIVGLLGR